MRGKGEGGGEEVDEGEEDEEAEDGVDEEGENQVVPWSMTPPPVASSSSSRGVTPYFLPQHPNKTQENKKQAAIFIEKSGAKPGNMFLPHLITSLHLSTTAAPGAYEVLRSHGLPIALLLKGVREFEVDGGARFRARLDAPSAPPSSRARFATIPPLAGTISPGQIAALSGVSAQDLFLWFPSSPSVSTTTRPASSTLTLASSISASPSPSSSSRPTAPPLLFPSGALSSVPSSSTAIPMQMTNLSLLGKLQYKLEQDVDRKAAT
ncbi:hypothetical protein C4D60_Mb05t12360 [Musa balbisiana]|uniref:Uncharacterized protein n=1 Tax=Musa balbisiana TaxID=52838 RepID=A0A4S8JVM3_MUSBA|nr:hypothetical protein C4D60_Mb05t12360 [Musa balbisiana]